MLFFMILKCVNDSVLKNVDLLFLHHQPVLRNVIVLRLFCDLSLEDLLFCIIISVIEN